MNIPYKKGYIVHQGPRRKLPQGPQPQIWQTNIQKSIDIKDLGFLLADGCKAEAFRIGGPTKFKPPLIEIEGAPGILHFAYAGSIPDENDMRKNGVIITTYATYYQGLPLRNIKPEYQEEILRQVRESSDYQIFKHKYERKLKLRGMHSD